MKVEPKTSMRIPFLAALLCCTVLTWGQECEYVAEGKVAKLLEKAEDKKKYDSDQRFEFYQDALEEDEYCFPAMLELGESSFKRAKRARAGFGQAERYFKQILEHCPEYHSRMYYFLGAICYAEQRYDEALDHFEQFLHFPDDSPSKYDKNYEKKYAEVEEALPFIQFYKDYFRHGNELETTLVNGVSSEKDEYLPAISPDGEIMFYTRKYMKKSKGDIVSRQVEEFTWSHRSDINASFDVGDALPAPFNMGDNYGGATISADNRELFVAKKNPVPSNEENIDLFTCAYELVFDEVKGKNVYKWSELKDLGPAINTESGWESQPSLSGDGKTLYFATVRENSIPDGDGNPSTDIYYSERQADGSWSTAKSIGETINTRFNEKAPFMHTDSKTLYFASNRKPGGGGYDIWYTKQKDDGTWEKPRNIGAPINSEDDEHGLIVSVDGEEAFFASRRVKGSKGLDIYSFPLPEDARPEKVMMLKGKVTDNTGEVPEDATVEVKYVQSDEIEKVEVNKDDGSYAMIVNVERNEDVLVKVKAKEAAFNTHVVVDRDEPIAPSVVKLSVETEKIEKSRPFLIPDIFYATNSSDISRSSKLVLDEFADYLNENPSISVEISGHTDDQGDVADNLALSMDRAFEVKGYLESKGVAGSRVTAKGYGESKPIADNGTAEGRAKNRRTEFVITRM